MQKLNSRRVGTALETKGSNRTAVYCNKSYVVGTALETKGSNRASAFPQINALVGTALETKRSNRGYEKMKGNLERRKEDEVVKWCNNINVIREAKANRGGTVRLVLKHLLNFMK